MKAANDSDIEALGKKGLIKSGKGLMRDAVTEAGLF